ncbi:hypothetical protein L6452_39044 [Arctium lappa]|uniref:Uncharacterized protein n=1 Tax=Arctium lappa TaxID=4217 RepID=A0ACB8XR84_ARCLA|nr:hypothetical protein L6452_39044 [Arctium lappa]
MHFPFLILSSLIIVSYSPHVATAPSTPNVLTQDSSLFVENNDLLVSPNGVFTAGFHLIGQNAYCFAIWFSEPMSDGNLTLIWMANRDDPVNGKRSKFSLLKTGNLVLTDAGRLVWWTNTKSTHLQLKLLDSGNLVLIQLDDQSYLWQTFSFPTDTILSDQPFTKSSVLVSSRSSTNLSSGYYKLYFDDDNVIRLVYDSYEITSVFWPKPWLRPWDAMRSTFNNSRFALLDSKGQFKSTDNLTFITTDYGQIHHRRMTLDVDGNVRVYTLNKGSWIVSWQAISKMCQVHGICGPNSLCTYSLKSGRRCSCMHGYKAKNHTDLSFGCEPIIKLTGHRENYEFIRLPHVEFYGFDSIYLENSTFKECHDICLNDSNCKAFQFTFRKNNFECYLKSLLFNGYYLGGPFVTYLKLSKVHVLSFDRKVANQTSLNCSSSTIMLKRTYETKQANGSLRFMLKFSIILGVIESMCLFVFFFYINQKAPGATTQYLAVTTGSRRFTYDEIKKASNKFREEIGRGGGGIVYKGILPDTREVAIKKLHDAGQGEAEFLAEMSIIGKINHMHLTETYGFCAEGKHRILVYEYLENGSLAGNLHTNQLDWQKRIAIATGVAKGLAYLHEECLEWVLHCDVKPQNILLDADYNPKVADFGLSKLFNRGAMEESIFSTIRGTRGYMAPEWVFDPQITSKVDVYSYGMVVLEMITGRSPTCDQDNQRVEQKSLVSWVREKVEKGNGESHEMVEILDPTVKGEYEKDQMENLLKVALQCVKEDKDARPTMSHVVKMLNSPSRDMRFRLN